MNYPKQDDRVGGSWRFRLIASGVFFMTYAGAAWDFWWHFHEMPEEMLSPPHLLLIVAAFSSLGLLVNAIIRNINKGYTIESNGFTFDKALPKPYWLSVAGGILLVSAFAVDFFISHPIWGFEAGVETLYSLSHLGIVAGIVMLNYGAFRATTQLQLMWGDIDWKGKLAAIISFSAALGMFWMLLIPVMPINTIHSGASMKPAIMEAYNFAYYRTEAEGSVGIFLYAAMLVGSMLRLRREIRLPFGSHTVIVMITNFILLSGEDHYEFLLITLLIGLVIDILLYYENRRWKQYVFSFIVPVIYFATYFMIVWGQGDVWWGAPLWLGVIPWSGFVGTAICWAIGDIRISPYHVNSPPY